MPTILKPTRRSSRWERGVRGTWRANRFAAPRWRQTCRPNRLALFLLLALTVQGVARGGEYTFVTLAGLGEGGGGYADGVGDGARFSYPTAVAVDSAGNVYVADTDNHTLRRIGPGGEVSTLAGCAGRIGRGDGTGGASRWMAPGGVAVDRAGNVYVADSGNHTIRKIVPGGQVTTLAGASGSIGSADGPGDVARFRGPSGVAVDDSGVVYVADMMSHTIRRIGPGGVVTTLAGLAGQSGSADGSGSAARFSGPQGVAVDGAGNLYVADTRNHTIRRLAPDGGVTTVAGTAGAFGKADGNGPAARFLSPAGLTVDASGNLYVADTGNHAIRRIGPSAEVTTVAGSLRNMGIADGVGSAARFWSPQGLAADAAGNVYVADRDSCLVRKIGPGGEVTTLAGAGAWSSGSADGAGETARFANPSSVALDAAGNVYVADFNSSTVRRIAPGGGVTTLAGVALGFGSVDGAGGAARFRSPNGLAVDRVGTVCVADYGNYTVRTIDSAGQVRTLAGLAGTSGSLDGTGDAARFGHPDGLAVDDLGNVFVADPDNSTIRRIGPGGVVTTWAGSAGVAGSADGSAAIARFDSPHGLAVDGVGNVYVADMGAGTIRKIGPDGAVSTLAGWPYRWGSADGVGNAARFDGPSGLAVDAAGKLYVTEWGDHTLRTIGLGGEVATVAGAVRSRGRVDGSGDAARFYYPDAVAVDAAGRVYVADSGNDRICVSVPTCPDRPVIDAPVGRPGELRQLDIAPASATSWQWRLVRRPTGSVAELSSTTERNPTFTPDVEDLYVFQLRATNALGEIGIRNLVFTASRLPVITGQPQNQLVPMGGQAVLSATAASADPLFYQWRKDRVDLPGATNATLVLAATRWWDAGAYQVVVRNAYGSVTSAPVALRLSGDPPVLLRSPRDAAVREGNPLVLNAPAAGWEPIAYQWFFNQAPLAGSNRFELRFDAAAVAQAGDYYARASNFFGATTSAVARVRVLQPLRVVVETATNRLELGQGATLRATVEGGESPRYQWQINGEAIGGATNASYNIAAARVEDGGSYRVVVGDGAELVPAPLPAIEINLPQYAPSPLFAARTALAGRSGNAASSNEGAASETGEPRHADKPGGHSIWYRWVAPAGGNARISTAGSAFDTLLAVYTGDRIDQLRPVAADDDGGGYLTSQVLFPVTAGVEYQIAVDGFSGATGRTVLRWELEVTPDLIPLLTQDPSDQAVEMGQTATFAVQADGANRRYQWLRNDQPIRGATQSALVLSNVQPEHVGAYRAWVIDATGTRSNLSHRARLEAYVSEGAGAPWNVGQDKPEDLSAAAAEAQRLGFGWTRIRRFDLGLSAGYTATQWADNQYDTTQPQENQQGGEISNNSRWFLALPLAVEFEGICTVSTEGSEIHTLLEVVDYAGLSPVWIASDEASAPDGRSWLQFQARPEGQYFIRVAGVRGESGPFKLTRRFEPAQRYRQWQRSAAASMSFQLQVPRDLLFRVDESPDLRAWTAILSTNSALGQFDLPVRLDPAPSQRFYRALLYLPPGMATFETNGVAAGQ